MHPGYSPISVYLHRDPVDFRKQINGLAEIVEGDMLLNPFEQSLYVFINRNRSNIKILYWDKNGFCLWQKRLELDRFAWPKGEQFDATHQIELRELQWLLEGLDPWHKNRHNSLNYKTIM